MSLGLGGDTVDRWVGEVAEAIAASMEEQCDFQHVGLIGASHVNWRKVAEAAIAAMKEANDDRS